MISSLKSAFPIFDQHPDLVFLDSASTTQKPRQVIESTNRFYTEENANIHRAVYTLSANASQRYEESRERTARFLHTQPDNIAFTSGTTASINLVAAGYLLPTLTADSNVVITLFEHHSNMIPWQMACEKSGAELRFVPPGSDGRLDLDHFQEMVDDHTKLIAITHVSNAMGTALPVEQVTQMAREKEIPILIDAAQSIAHHPIDLKRLDCDFLTFSAHKAYGPLGVGVLYAHNRVKDHLRPVQFGGGMVQQVTTTGSSFKKYPYFVEAGTVNIAGVLGWSAALDFLNEMDRVACHDTLRQLHNYLVDQLGQLPEVRIEGAPEGTICSFNVEDVHPHDVATVLSDQSVAVRAGRHCCQPLLDALGLGGTVRVSLAVYNEQKDIDRLIQGLQKTIAIFHENKAGKTV